MLTQGPGKVAWTEKDVETDALAMKAQLPAVLLSMIDDDGWHGGEIVQLESDMHRPSCGEIALNYPYLKGLVQNHPHSVPGGIYLTDVVLFLDSLLDGKLLVQRDGKTKKVLAGEEAERLKRLLGALRALWRSSPGGAHHPRVTELKSFLKESPKKGQAAADHEHSPEALPVMPALNDDGNGVAEPEFESANEESSDGESDEAGAHACIHPVEPGDSAPESANDGSIEDDGLASSDDGDSEAERPAVPSGSGDGPNAKLLTKRTLMLGEDDSSDLSGSDASDKSQPGTPLVAKPHEKEWQENVELFLSPMAGNSGPRTPEIIDKSLDVMRFIQNNHQSMCRHPKFMQYLHHIDWSLARFGPRAACWLTTPDHFDESDASDIDNVKKALKFSMDESEAEHKTYQPLASHDCGELVTPRSYGLMSTALNEDKFTPPPVGRQTAAGMKKQQEELEESKRADSKTSKVKGVISKDKSKSMASTSKASTSKACKETSSPLPAAHLFKGYNLKDLGVPRCAWPDESKAIEVLCNKRCYVIKRVGFGASEEYDEPLAAPARSCWQLHVEALLTLVGMMFSTNVPLTPLDHVETFAGEMAVTIGEWQDGSRGSTKRTKACPLGDDSYQSVRDANMMVARVVCLLVIATARQIWWVLEQPCNSLLESHPLFQRMLRLKGFRVKRHSTCMLYYGGPTRKPTWLYSSIADLAYYADKSAKPQTEDVEMTVKYVDGSGKSRVKGGKDLKQSQAYPRRCLAFEIKRIKGSYCWF
ncbi:unnamed protein product [Durusdinium trenchii]|uniref:Uncharacterized protein n=1 Tax=Durusdinium trenchii TaxID=1381693 RepID=A0ABP0PZS3_9DINO